MKTFFLKATPGWGTLDIDSVVNNWLANKKIKIIDIKYESHTEKFKNVSGQLSDGIVYTALIIYEDLP